MSNLIPLLHPNSELQAQTEGLQIQSPKKRLITNATSSPDVVYVCYSRCMISLDVFFIFLHGHSGRLLFGEFYFYEHNFSKRFLMFCSYK